MNAQPLLATVARVLHQHGLEAILIGNAAAAIHGAPVTTLDFDFLYRKTPATIRKLKAVAASLSAVLMKPLYPVSDLFRIVRDEDGLQLDFMGAIHGVRSFASLGSRARLVNFGEHPLLVAGLADIIRSKRAANRPRDKAVLETLEATLEEKGNLPRRPPEGSPSRKRRRPS